MTYCIAVSHTPWVPERVETYKRLCDSLQLDSWDTVPPGRFKCFDEKEPNGVWSRKMWAWAAAQAVDWCVFLQDDTVVSPSFHSDLEHAIAKAWDIIGLQVAHPIAPGLFNEGYLAFTTTDAVVGVGYAVWRETLREFLDWLSAHEDVAAGISEDTLLGAWCALTGRNIYHPIPTCVDHDTTVPSTYANDGHGNRRSRVNWTAPKRDTIRTDTPHAGCFYNTTPDLARLLGCDDATYKRLKSDNGQRLARKVGYMRRARMADDPIAKIFIASPVRGEIHPNFAATIWRIMRDEDIEVDDASNYQMFDVQMQSTDVVRCRSKLVSTFLNSTDATHILFLDDDIECPPKVVRGMIAADRAFVGCPYPRRDALDFKAAQKNTSLPGEASAYKYSVRLGFDIANQAVMPDKQGCVEVQALPLGCALIKRELLQKMCEAFPELTFEDEGFGSSVALFQLILDTKQKALLSEDYSFCLRVAACGEKVWMFLGDGSPVNHWGGHCYKGAIEAFRLRRV